MEGGKEGAGVMKKTDIIPTRPTRASIQSGRKKRKETGGKKRFLFLGTETEDHKASEIQVQMYRFAVTHFPFFSPPKARVRAEPKQQQQKNNEYNKQKRPTNTNKLGEILETN